LHISKETLHPVVGHVVNVWDELLGIRLRVHVLSMLWFTSIEYTDVRPMLHAYSKPTLMANFEHWRPWVRIVQLLRT